MSLKTAMTAFFGGTVSFVLMAGAASAEWSSLNSADGTTVYAQDRDGAVIMGCTSAGDFALGFMLAEGDVAEAVSNLSDRWKLRRGRLSVAGEEVFNNKFVYKPASRIAETNHPRAMVRVYNAAIRGDSIDFDLGRHGGLSMDLPEVNGTFQGFAADCIDGNLAE